MLKKQYADLERRRIARDKEGNDEAVRQITGDMDAIDEVLRKLPPAKLTALPSLLNAPIVSKTPEALEEALIGTTWEVQANGSSDTRAFEFMEDKLVEASWSPHPEPWDATGPRSAVALVDFWVLEFNDSLTELTRTNLKTTESLAGSIKAEINVIPPSP
ncbi:MAG: hypothetical protein AAGD22_10160 [Verrucomicrobiota bacterium]